MRGELNLLPPINTVLLWSVQVFIIYPGEMIADNISLQLDWGLVWLPRSPSLPAVASLGRSRGRTVAVARWRQQQECDIGDQSAHGTGYSSGSSPSALSFLVFFSSSSSGFGQAAPPFLAVRVKRYDVLMYTTGKGGEILLTDS